MRKSPSYLVIEDSFPNGRPALEKGFGVYMADRETVNLSERMKVTVCLNPVHSATGPLGVVLGYDLFAHMLNTNPDMMKMARMVAYDEGLPVVPNPGILSPQEFTDELFNDRFPNEYLGDTNLRLAVDVSRWWASVLERPSKRMWRNTETRRVLPRFRWELPDGSDICWRWTMRERNMNLLPIR